MAPIALIPDALYHQQTCKDVTEIGERLKCSVSQSQDFYLCQMQVIQRFPWKM